MFTRENPSPDYLAQLDWSKQFHAQRKTFTGRRTFHAYPTIRTLCRQHRPETLLDYGCGKAAHYGERDIKVKDWLTVPTIAEDLGYAALALYDPAVPEFETPPVGRFGGVIVVDALEYVPDADLVDWVLPELVRYATKFLFVNYSCLGTTKVDGDAAPRTVRDPGWLLRHLDAAACEHGGPLLDWVVRMQINENDPRRVYRRCLGGARWTLADIGQLYG